MSATELKAREMFGCGPNGEARLLLDEDDGTVYVEVANDHGAVRIEVERHEALHVFDHPFAQDRGLSIPQARGEKPWTPEEQRIYLGIELTEAGDSDVPASPEEEATA
jgi:hypothetical protein